MFCPLRFRFFAITIGTISFCTLLGCGDAETKVDLVTVSGTVLFEGNSAERGLIRFIPDVDKENDGPTRTVNIVDGKFSGEVVSGAQLLEVEIFGGAPEDGSGEYSGEFEVLGQFTSRIDVGAEGRDDLALKFGSSATDH